MAEDKKDSIMTPPEQLAYANILKKGMLIGLGTLFVTFFIYCFGLIKPYIPLERLPKYWSMSVHKYLETTHAPHGWDWIRYLIYGDYLNFTGIVILAGITIICFLRIIPVFLQKKDKTYALLGLIQALVLILAASGIIKVGH